MSSVVKYNLLLDHVGLPQVVIVVVHLVTFCAGQVKGIILRHIYTRHFVARVSFMVKSYEIIILSSPGAGSIPIPFSQSHQS